MGGWLLHPFGGGILEASPVLGKIVAIYLDLWGLQSSQVGFDVCTEQVPRPAFEDLEASFCASVQSWWCLCENPLFGLLLSRVELELQLPLKQLT